MKILISTDMEGVTGVTAPEDVHPGSPAWDRFRRLFVRDVNAAIAGACEVADVDVLVTEGHNRMRNLLIEDLDERAQLLVGPLKTYAMMEGIDRDIDLVFLVGYHAAAGEEGVLSHTFLGKGLVDLRLNGQTCSEGRMNAMLAGSYGVGVGLLTGDQAACADATRFIPGIRTVAVKEQIDRYSAICLPPARTERAIREAAAAAVQNASAHRPLVADPPYRWSASFGNAGAAGRAALVPGVERVETKTVMWSDNDFAASLKVFQLVATLVGGAFESPVFD
jgi:D-amino peptidase